jgi:hypothetical protein
MALWLAGAVAALVVAAVALIGRRPKGACCPRCRYAVAGAAVEATRCPECGFAAASERDWFRRRRRPWTGCLAVLVALALVAVPFREPLRIWGIRTFLDRYVEIGRGKAGRVTILREHDRWNDLGLPEWFGPDRLVAVLPDGTRQMLLGEDHIELGVGRHSGMPPDDSPGFGAAVPRGIRSRDADPIAEPGDELLVLIPSGGSGGYVTTVLYSIGPGGLRPKSVLENGWMDDVDHDGAFEVVAFISDFAYVWTSGAGSTRPTVYLDPRGWDTGMWTVDARSMWASGPSDEDLQALRDRIAAADPARSEEWMSPLLRGVLGLLYSGQARRAEAFLRESYRGDATELSDFVSEFRQKFEGSPFAEQVRGLSRGQEPWP